MGILGESSIIDHQASWGYAEWPVLPFLRITGGGIDADATLRRTLYFYL